MEMKDIVNNIMNKTTALTFDGGAENHVGMEKMENEYDQIETNIIETFLLMSGKKDIKNTSIKVSNGLSAVFITDEDPFVFQVYKIGEVSSKINNLLSRLKTDVLIYFDLGYDDLVKYEYNIKKHYPLVLGNYDCCIKWEKITPLNSFTKDKLFNIIKNNLVKLMWDIGKVLKGFHKNGMYHGDSRIDNIGIKNGNFVLFDFDSSRVFGIEMGHILSDKMAIAPVLSGVPMNSVLLTYE